MLDINLLRNDPEKVRENIRKKFQDAKLPMVDEVIAMDRIEGLNGEEIKIKVVGIFKPKNISESYWVEPQKAYSLEVFTSKELLEEVFTGHTNDSSGKTLYDVKAFTLFDYENDEVVFNELRDYKGNLLKRNLFIKITVIILITGIVLKILMLIGYKKEILIK
jgi:hypothetical protein